MKYSETELTEATKILSYLRSMQIYAAMILCASLLYIGLKMYQGTKGTELYLLYVFTGIIFLGSLSLIIRLNNITANIYGLSCTVAGAIYLFLILYYRGDTPGFFTAVGAIIGLLVLRQGVSVAFGKRSQEAFSRANQKKVSFIRNLLKTLKPPFRGEENTIYSIYTDDRGKRRTLSIKLLDDVACFLFEGEKTPTFFERNSVYVFELQRSKTFLKVSINVDNHEWVEAEFKAGDLKKYEAWKDR
jgi:hypothetical protein